MEASILFFLVFIAYVLVGLYRKWALANNIIDIPNSRSAHVEPIVRGGGIVFAGAWLLVFLLGTLFRIFPEWMLTSLWPGAFLMMSIGMLDDKYSLSAKFRLLAQLLAATWLVWSVGEAHILQVISRNFFTITADVSITIVAIVWSINLYNFMDGSDGLAGLEAIFVLGAAALYFYVSTHYELSFLLASLCAFLAGFLLWNWPPAKLFMGDAGSCFLGYVVAGFILVLHNVYQVSLIPCLIIYSLFVFDTTVTVLRRFCRGEKCYQAHNLHAYQRVKKNNYSSKFLLLNVLVFNTFFLGVAVFVFIYPQYQWLGLLVTVTTLFIPYWLLEKAEPMWKVLSKDPSNSNI